MSDARRPSRSAGQRRIRYSVTTAVLFAAVTASCLIAGALGGRYKMRVDVTATREYALSARTEALLATVDRPHTIVVSADFQQMDRRARQRIRDVIIEFTETSPLIRSMEIDTATGDGRQAFGGLLADLAAQYQDTISQQKTRLARAGEETGSAAAGLNRVAEQLRALQPRLPDSAAGTDVVGQAEVLVRLASELEQAAVVVTQAGTHEVMGVALPEGDVAQDAAMTRLEQAARAMTTVAGFADALRAESEEPTLVTSCQIMAEEARRVAAGAATTSDDLRRIRPLTPLLIARVLQAQNAVLIVSDTDVQAIEFDALFPSTARIDAAGGSEAEIRFAGEELIATAIGGMNMNRPPIVVFVHGEQTRLFDDSGRPTSPALRAFRRLFERLRLRGIDVAEWAMHFDSVRPQNSEIMARISAANSRRTGTDRPIVWVMLGPPARRGPAGTAERLEIVARMADGLAGLIQDGQPVLVNVDPSDLAAFSESDPIAGRLTALGLKVDSARPLMRVVQTPTGPATYVSQVSREANEAHPVGGAIDGLALILPWVTSMSIAEQTGDHVVTPLITIPDDVRTWAESEWLGFRNAPQRDPAMPLMLANPPTPLPALDGVNGPWIVAAAVKTPATAGTSESRAIVVGSPSWFGDQYIELAELVQNRRVWRYPGNAELFEASVFWLAGLDEFVAPSAQAHDIDRIGDLSEGQLTAIRWFLIAGMPVGVLLAGGLLRVIRG
ncbi:MAG: hypothetical protein KDA21_04880 [Phycisphaerales bacterium]|nr:hypothetical protein [Phycisphaerales bacterium]